MLFLAGGAVHQVDDAEKPWPWWKSILLIIVWPWWKSILLIIVTIVIVTIAGVVAITALLFDIIPSIVVVVGLLRFSIVVVVGLALLICVGVIGILIVDQARPALPAPPEGEIIPLFRHLGGLPGVPPPSSVDRSEFTALVTDDSFQFLQAGTLAAEVSRDAIYRVEVWIRSDDELFEERLKAKAKDFFVSVPMRLFGVRIKSVVFDVLLGIYFMGHDRPAVFGLTQKESDNQQIVEWLCFGVGEVADIVSDAGELKYVVGAVEMGVDIVGAMKTDKALAINAVKVAAEIARHANPPARVVVVDDNLKQSEPT